MRLWEDYNERKITTGQLLKKCSAIYAPVQMKDFLTRELIFIHFFSLVLNFT